MMQFELPMPVIEAVAQWAHDAGVPVMINPAPAAPLSDRLLACATYLSPNEHEAAILAGHSIDVSNGINMDDVAVVAQAFQARGVENLIITMGGERLHRGGQGRHPPHPLREDAPRWRTPPPPATPSWPPSAPASPPVCPRVEALAFASHTAALTVSQMGAMPSLPTVDQVQQLLVPSGATRALTRRSWTA